MSRLISGGIPTPSVTSRTNDSLGGKGFFGEGELQLHRRVYALANSKWSVWTAKTGGTQLTDLLDSLGTVATIVQIDDLGLDWPIFSLPEGWLGEGVWMQREDPQTPEFPNRARAYVPVQGWLAATDANMRLTRSSPVIGINQSTLPPHLINSVAGAPVSGTVYYTPLILDPISSGTATTYSIQYAVTTAFNPGSGSGQMTSDVWPDLVVGNGPDFSQPPIKTPVNVTITATGLTSGPTGIVVNKTTKVWVGTLYTATTPTTPLQLSCVGSVVPNIVTTASTNTPAPGRGLVLTGQTVAPVQNATPTLTASAAATVPVAMGRRTG